MQISLGKRAPSMWFLGEPRNLIASLGPLNKTAEIDFDSLDKDLQKKVINDITIGILESDEDLLTLRQKWIGSYGMVSNPVVRNQPIKIEIEKKIKKIEKPEIDPYYTNYLLNNSVEMVKEKLISEKNTKALKKIMELEMKGKKRKTIIKFLQKKIYGIMIDDQKKLTKKIDIETREQIENQHLKDKLDYDVIEEEYRTIVLDPKELIEFAAK